MPINSVEHTWIPDPDIASAAKGADEFGGAPVLNTHDASLHQLMQEMLVELKKIEYHLHCMTDVDLEKGAL